MHEAATGQLREANQQASVSSNYHPAARKGINAQADLSPIIYGPDELCQPGINQRSLNPWQPQANQWKLISKLPSKVEICQLTTSQIWLQKFLIRTSKTQILSHRNQLSTHLNLSQRPQANYGKSPSRLLSHITINHLIFQILM